MYLCVPLHLEYSFVPHQHVVNQCVIVSVSVPVYVCTCLCMNMRAQWGD